VVSSLVRNLARFSKFAKVTPFDSGGCFDGKFRVVTSGLKVVLPMLN